MICVKFTGNKCLSYVVRLQSKLYKYNTDWAILLKQQAYFESSL